MGCLVVVGAPTPAKLFTQRTVLGRRYSQWFQWRGSSVSHMACTVTLAVQGYIKCEKCRGTGSRAQWLANDGPIPKGLVQ
jgi:hypothetical protein